MKIAIADDDPKEIETFKTIINEFARIKQMEIDLSCFCSAEELLADFSDRQYDAVFLDIYMDGMNGIEAAQKIRTVDDQTELIFLTSSRDHMSEAFHAHVFDYIQKPADRDRIFSVLEDLIRKQNIATGIPMLSFSARKKDFNLKFSEIKAVSADANYLEIIDRSGNTYHPRMTFSTVSELLLQDPRFLLVLRGILINMDYVISIGEKACQLEGGITLPINAKNSRKIEQAWQDYTFSRIRQDSLWKRRD